MRQSKQGSVSAHSASAHRAFVVVEHERCLQIVGKSGKLLYQGAIDNNASGFSKEEVLKADNYVAGALDRILAGKSVTDSDTKSYGCSVKYAKKSVN